MTPPRPGFRGHNAPASATAPTAEATAGSATRNATRPLPGPAGSAAPRRGGGRYRHCSSPGTCTRRRRRPANRRPSPTAGPRRPTRPSAREGESSPRPHARAPPLPRVPLPLLPLRPPRLPASGSAAPPSPRLAPPAPPRASHWLRREAGAGRRGRAASPIGRQHRPLTGKPGFYRPRPNARAERSGTGCGLLSGGGAALSAHALPERPHRAGRSLCLYTAPSGKAAAAAPSAQGTRAPPPQQAGGDSSFSPAAAGGRAAAPRRPYRPAPSRDVRVLIGCGRCHSSHAPSGLRGGSAAPHSAPAPLPGCAAGGGGGAAAATPFCGRPFPLEDSRKGSRHDADASCPGGSRAPLRLLVSPGGCVVPPSPTTGRSRRRRAPSRRLATGFKAAALLT